MAHDHHAHGAGTVGTDASHRARVRALQIALGANAAFFVVQLIAGIAFGSLALIADSAHMASDVVALALALLAQALSTRPASNRNTYGMLRAEVLAAQANAVALVLVSGWVVFEAVQRFSSPEPIDGLGVLVVGLLGLVVNAGSVWVIARAGGDSLNLRGAFLHLASDAAGSVGVVIAGVIVLTTGAEWVDPLVSILISVLVLFAAWQLLRDTTRVLLEGVPKGLDVDAVEQSLQSAEGVEAVHHLHVWSLGSETPALSVHVVLGGRLTLHEAQTRGDQLKHDLAERFGIEHATLELECHQCEDDEHDLGNAEPGGDVVTEVTTTEIAPPNAPADDDRSRGSRGPAWWQVIALVVALCLLAGIVGWRIGQSEPADPGHSSVDVGFMYDMTADHQQAITMALIYLRNGDDPLLLAIAKEIVQYQSSEIGMMNEYLSQWGQAGNRPDKAMGWMQPPVARDQMPGLATPEQMQQLQNARGFELDKLFTQLMIEHHVGGIHMAAYAAKHAEKESTRLWATRMDDGQRGEISEMNQWRTRHDLPTIVPPIAEFSD